MIFKHLAFDMDGTLINSIPSIMQSFQEAVKSVYGHYEKDEEILKHSIGLPLAESFKYYNKSDEAALQAAYIKANDFLQKDGVPFFDGVKDMLIKLKESGHILHIVTSKRKNATMHWAEVMGVTDLFDVIVGKEDTQKHKPDGDPILECIKRIGCDKKDFIYVGDSVHDIGCAHNAGVKVIVCDWTEMNKEELKNAKPDYWITTPEDIFSIVD